MELWCGLLEKSWIPLKLFVFTSGKHINEMSCERFLTIVAILICLSFVSSFNDKQINEADVDQLGQDLFEKEQDDLLKDLLDIPRKACDRRVWFMVFISKLPLPLFDNLHACIFSYTCSCMVVCIVFKIDRTGMTGNCLEYWFGQRGWTGWSMDQW